MPKKQNTAARKARAASRTGEKYTAALRRYAGPSAATLAHRSLLDHPPGFRPFRGTDLFDRIGGQPTVDRLVDLLYDGIADDRQLRPLFPRDLDAGRAMQKLFFAEWLGGPGRYSEQAYAGLGHRHDGVPITTAVADRWLGHFRRALDTVVPAADRDAIWDQVRALAGVLRNEAPQVAQVAWCGIRARTVKRATDAARRGDVAGVSAVLSEAPELLRPRYAAAVLQAAALAGRAEAIRLLLDQGVGPDHPYYLPVSVTGTAFERVVFVTPVCAARLKRRTAVVSLLRGAHDDVFTAAFLGDGEALTRMLAADPDLAHAPDPALDVLDVTPVDHAVAGGQPATLGLLLDRDGVLAGGVRALRGAAAQGEVEMVEALLAHGADATRIGTGRWVLHPQLAPLLAARGAAVDSSWIGASCTGNQGRRDDPEYVRALLRHGARADDRRGGGTGGVAALNATALHYASKAGFLQTISVLLSHGADPAARDSQGRTPQDWLEQAAPSVSRSAVRELLAGR